MEQTIKGNKMNRDHETEEYRFNEQAHLHELNVDGKWKALTGVTTILSVISKPALIQWAANMAIDYIKEKLSYVMEEGIDEETAMKRAIEVMADAKVAHRKKKESAGDWGTDIHSKVESFIKDTIAGKESDVDEKIKSFVEWSHKENIKYLSTEKHVYSKSMWVGGIADFICEIDGKLFVGDVKTSSNIYPEHFIQASAYAEMLKEMGNPAVDGVIIVNLDKKGGFKVEKMFNPVRYFEAFKCALGLYRFTEELKTLTK